VAQARGPKIMVFKFKRRRKYRRKTGHRQALTRLRVEEIVA
jgi:large subunit ribosomal protein L21